MSSKSNERRDLRVDDAKLDMLKLGVEAANVPSLLMVLVQLTGEEKWLKPPYAPRRARGLDDNDSGGLPEDIQAEIRSAALDAILAWQSGKPVALARPDDEMLARMLAVSMGEEVPANYGEIIASDMGFVKHRLSDSIPAPPARNVSMTRLVSSELLTWMEATPASLTG